MTLRIKDSTELDSQGKPGASSQNSENRASQSPRSNPVCLEVGVTLRSLPAESGGPTQPIRQESRTVIVFDNGAVLRSSNNLPIGQTVILSNPNGREVICRVVGGRNLPTVKGYVEVEFIESVNDFWHIHQDAEAFSVPAPPAPALAPPQLLAEPSLQPPITPRAAGLEKPASLPSGSGPSFADIAGVVSMSPPTGTREKKINSARPSAELRTKDDSAHNLAETNKPASSTTSWSSISELPSEEHAIPAARESSWITPRTPTPSSDFMSKGLMAYGRPGPSSGASSGRMPLIVGGAALVLAGFGAGMYLMHRRTAPVPAPTMVVASQPSTPEPPAASGVPEPVQAPQGASAEEATQAQPAAAEQGQPMAAVAAVPAVAPVPAVVTSPAVTDSPKIRRLEQNTNTGKQPDLSSSRRQVIPNLKMGSPSAPKHNLTNLGEGSTPATDIASPEAAGGVTPAGLLTSAARTSTQPLPPPSAPATVTPAKTVRDARLISSTRPLYPAAARESNIQGNVLVSASIDEHGNVVGVKALSGPMFLRQAALDSVKQWKYSPALIDGKPASSQVSVNVDFQLK